MKVNLNDRVKVRLKEKGIRKIVENINIEGLPLKYHTSYEKEKAKLNSRNERFMQLHQFIDHFGGLGITLDSYIDINIEILSD